MGAIEDRIMLSTSNLPQMDAVLITTFVLPNTSETGSVDGLSNTTVSGHNGSLGLTPISANPDFNDFGLLNPNPPMDRDGRREDSGRG